VSFRRDTEHGDRNGIGHEGGGRRPKVCVVGSSQRFLSGISNYTHEVAIALSDRFAISVILMRQLIPTRFYPGKTRVGQNLSILEYPTKIHVFDGVDWFWGSTLLRSLRFLRSESPDFVILEWWTGAVLHTYLVLAVAARLLGARIVIEFHEVQDVGELQIPLVGRYVSLAFPLLLRMASGSIVHSEHDRIALQKRFGADLGNIATFPHAPYGFFGPSPDRVAVSEPSEVTQLLSFGVIRPFKGVDDLIAAFNGLSSSDAHRFHLTIVGETWEGFDVGPLVESSPYRDQITFVNRYVHDHELSGYLERSDAVVLPYHRSSSSGPLCLTMGVGLPVIVSRVGGLIEAAEDYDGTIFVEPRNVDDLRRALVQVESLRGQRFESKGSWLRTADAIADLLSSISVAAA
jgi:glycosyltransferase involved in cell wall biosynthesis